MHAVSDAAPAATGLAPGRLQASLSFDQASRLLALAPSQLQSLVDQRQVGLVPAPDGLRLHRAALLPLLAARLGPAALAERQASRRPLLVLLVDDDKAARTWWSRLIERSLPGALVTAVNGSDQASALLSEVLPDVVVTDLSMPSDGYRLAWWLHLAQGYTGVTSIVLSGLDPEAVRRSGGLPPHVPLVHKHEDPSRLLTLLLAAEQLQSGTV